LGIERDCDFIQIGLKISALSINSIITTVTFTNNSEKDFILYKPLLPYPDFTENCFGLVEKETYKKVPFTGIRRERYLEDGIPHLVGVSIIPTINNENLVKLKPKGSLSVRCNIANKFNFDLFLKNGRREFEINYGCFTPSIVNSRQEREIDSVDKIEKPVYYFIVFGNKQNSDSMNVRFRIPY
jgi:hypothetical protein